MREKDEIAGLFRRRLANAEMTVRDGFWEQLQEGLLQAETSDNAALVTESLAAPAKAPAANSRKKAFFSPEIYRVAAAASVLLVLGVASAAFWYLSPREEIKEAFIQVAALTPEGSLNGDIIQENFPSIHDANTANRKPGMKQPASAVPSAMAAQTEDEDESVSVRVSITITQRVYGSQQQMSNSYFSNNASTQLAENHNNTTGHRTNTSSKKDFITPEEELDDAPLKCSKSRKWALKAALGTSLPKYDSMSFSAGVAVERSLSNWLAVEAGIQYKRLHSGDILHTLAIPIKFNMTFLSTSKVDLYAVAGGTAEKCVAGAVDNGFSAEPVRLGVEAGVGVRYKLSDRFALFAEPSVSHHFSKTSNSEIGALRDEKLTNMNLLCGVRMTY